MAKQNEAQKETMERVMHEWKHGELETPAGDKVRDYKQAVAIGLSESGSSNQQTPAQNRKQLNRSKKKEANGETGQAEADPTKAELYAEAKKQDLPGRSKMSKADLQRALKG